jgi:hypothetical protein
MATRDAAGRFAPKPRAELSPAYRRRLERAEAQGKSRAQARGHGTQPRRAWETAQLVGTERYERALQVVSRVRHGASLSRAAREVGISPDTVLRYAGSAFTRDGRGRWTATPSDRLARRMKWLDGRGLTSVEPATSKEASKLSAYWRAVDHFLLTGDDRPLRRFRRMRLRTRQKATLGFVTDPGQLERLGQAGQLSFEDLYEH